MPKKQIRMIYDGADDTSARISKDSKRLLRKELRVTNVIQVIKMARENGIDLHYFAYTYNELIEEDKGRKIREKLKGQGLVFEKRRQNRVIDNSIKRVIEQGRSGTLRLENEYMAQRLFEKLEGTKTRINKELKTNNSLAKPQVAILMATSLCLMGISPLRLSPPRMKLWRRAKSALRTGPSKTKKKASEPRHTSLKREPSFPTDISSWGWIYFPSSRFIKSMSLSEKRRTPVSSTP